MSKNFWRHLSKGMVLLLTVSLLTCALFKKPPTIYVPVEELVVQKLPNGHWEVTEGLVLNYARALAEINILKARIRELEKK